MTGIEILLIVSLVMQVIAIIIALPLINHTKYSALWICCIVALATLSVERILQLRIFDGFYISDLTFGWIGVIVSLSFSICVVCAHFLVRHVDHMTLLRQLMENRVMTAVLRTEEQSRATLSRDLHDGLGPLLSSAKMSLSALQRAELNDKDRETLKNTSAVIDEAIRSLREISNNLSPHILNNFGLARGIKNFVDKVGAMHNVKVLFTSTIGSERYDSNIEIILYRVVCELVNNSLKHSKCSKIEIRLKQSGSIVVVDYSDDGIGFSPREVQDTGMGLSNINSRISSLSGKIKINSSPNNGMTAHIEIDTTNTLAHLSKEDYKLLYGKNANKQ